MKPPIYNVLAKYASKQRIKFCSPGHRNKIRMKTDNLCRIDVDKIPFIDSDTDYMGALIKSQEEISGIFASAKSFYLNNGTSSGILASLSSVCAPGDKVIVDQECDKAIIDAITVLALQPVFLKRTYCAKYSLNGGISTEEIENTIFQASDAKLIIITSPSYYGVCANIKKIVEYAHPKGIYVMVDESYGAHFNFAKHAPETALECGADIVVQSVSKTLGGFNGSGLLHLSQTIDESTTNSICANLDIYQSGGHSSAFTCATENVLMYAFANSGKYNLIYREIERGKQIIEDKTDILWFGAEQNNGSDIFCTDKSKLVLNFSLTNTSAAEAAQILMTKYGIEADYADKVNLVFSVSLYNTASDIRKLVNSCLAISRILVPADEEISYENEEYANELFDEGPRALMSPYKAFHSGGEWVSLDAAVGKICRKTVGRLPHGTPIIIPGEKINREMISTIISLTDYGVKIYGLSPDNKIEVLSLSDSFYY